MKYYGDLTLEEKISAFEPSKKDDLRAATVLRNDQLVHLIDSGRLGPAGIRLAKHLRERLYSSRKLLGVLFALDASKRLIYKHVNVG